MSKWFVEVVKDNFTGLYHANMMVDGKVVDGLVRDADYNILRKDIQEKTGMEIPLMKDMKFGKHNGKQYAYLDYTQERLDARVPLRDVLQGRYTWRPDFDGILDAVGKQVLIGPRQDFVEKFDDMFFDVGTVLRHQPAIAGELCDWKGEYEVQMSDRFYLDGRQETLNVINHFSDSVPLLSSGAKELALQRLDVLRDEIIVLLEMPKLPVPRFGIGISVWGKYFDTVDFVACSDSQLAVADMLVKKHIGPKASVLKLIQNEMVARLEERVSLEAKLGDAYGRADGSCEHTAVKSSLDLE